MATSLGFISSLFRTSPSLIFFCGVSFIRRYGFSIIPNDIVLLLLYLYDVVNSYDCIRSLHDKCIRVRPACNWPFVLQAFIEPGPAGVLDDPGSWNDGFASTQDITSWAVPEATSRGYTFEIGFVDYIILVLGAWLILSRTRTECLLFPYNDIKSRDYTYRLLSTRMVVLNVLRYQYL